MPVIGVGIDVVDIDRFVQSLERSEPESACDLWVKIGRWYGEHLSTNVPEANAYLTAMKRLPEFAYLGEVSSVPLQQVLRTQQKAFVNFFAKRARYPRVGYLPVTSTVIASADGGFWVRKSGMPRRRRVWLGLRGLERHDLCRVCGDPPRVGGFAH